MNDCWVLGLIVFEIMEKKWKFKEQSILNDHEEDDFSRMLHWLGTLEPEFYTE